MRRRIAPLLQAALVCIAATAPAAADAIPAFARKYGTSCLTCHTVYPRLTPFGEAFRRNGYRFPGVDSDFWKQDVVALGQEVNKKTFPASVWPDAIPASVPIAIGANGQAVVSPDKNSSFGRANNGAHLMLDQLVSEGHLWVGSALDETITLWGELTFSSDGVDVEHAQVLFNDVVGPAHAFNFDVGRGFPTIGSFGPHSSYLGDARITTVPVTGIYGLSSDPFTLVDNYDGLEVTGVLGGFFDYSAGLQAGKNVSGAGFDSENWYAHAGYKLGGLRLDGEGSQGPPDPLKPWAEDAVTLDVFVFHSREYFPAPGAAPGSTAPPFGDSSFTVGGTLRAQLGSLELDAGAYTQSHDNGTAGTASVRADVEYGELSYVLYPWLVPALRVERIGLGPSDGPGVSALHFMPGVALLIRANVKVVLVANIESASGYPVDAGGSPLGWSGGNADWGGFVSAPGPGALPGTSSTEFESFQVFLAWAL